MSEWRDPPRLFERDELPHEVRLSLARYATEAPEPERRGRMRARLESELGLAPATSGSNIDNGANAGPGLGALPSGLLKLKLLLAGVALLAGSLGLYGLVTRDRPEASRADSRDRHAALTGREQQAGFRAVAAALLPASEAATGDAPLASSRAQPPPTPALAPEIASVPSPRAEPLPRRAARARAERARARPVAAASPSEAVSLDDAGDAVAELTLLARARRVLLSDPARSLELAEQHARAYPNGTLGEEREVLAIESLLKLGRRADAAARARRFELRFPSSAHRAHLARIFVTPVE
jgi:hypothetical protein